MSEHVYIARQPIVTVDNQTFGYELLFRALQDDGSVAVDFSDEMIATTRVVVNVLNHMGIEDVVGDAKAFINVDKELLLDDILLSIPKDRFIIELLEHIIVDDAVINRLKELKELGYTFGLDDAHCDDDFIKNFSPIFPLIDILKLDVSLIVKSRLEERMEAFRNLPCKLLAEKVETQEEFDYYKSLGCELFQGYFFAKPDIVKKQALDPAYKKIFKLINILDKDCEISEISLAFQATPEITLQLLRFMNAGALSLRTDIKSIEHAVTLLGKRPLKQWLLLIAFSKSDRGNGSFSSPLFALAQSRAILMSELMLKFSKDKKSSQEAAFVGVLSLIDVITKTSMETVLKELNIDESIKAALLNHQGELGLLLELAVSMESFDIAKSNELLASLNLTHEQLKDALSLAYKN